jgi:hypothetical protein
MKTKKADQLEQLVGEQVYSIWIDMLRRLVPEGRTHRLAPTVAALLQYAVVVALEKQGNDPVEGSAAQRLIDANEMGPDEAEELVLPLVKKLFKDAGVEYQRTSARGEEYSIATEAIREYIEWFNMPWE